MQNPRFIFLLTPGRKPGGGAGRNRPYRPRRLAGGGRRERGRAEGPYPPTLFDEESLDEAGDGSGGVPRLGGGPWRGEAVSSA